MNHHKYPEFYHKNHNKRNYFEGWYFKQVTQDCKHALIFIPGVSFEKDVSHCFIQCLHYYEDNILESYNVDFPINDFKSRNYYFGLNINKNIFSFEGIKLNISDNNLSIKGSIKFQDITPIKTNVLSPNIMGFFSYIPFMECNHGILSMNHEVSGKIIINGEVIDFTGGKGYIEKDWGRSFPEKYIWVHSNHFDNSSVSLFCSVAKIPFGLFSFTGLICNLIIDDVEYRFATYNGAKLKLKEISEKEFELIIKRNNYILELKGSKGKTKELLAPKLGSMSKTIKEGLSGKLSIILKKNTSEIIYKGKSNKCGIELEY